MFGSIVWYIIPDWIRRWWSGEDNDQSSVEPSNPEADIAPPVVKSSVGTSPSTGSNVTGRNKSTTTNKKSRKVAQNPQDLNTVSDGN